MKKKMNILLLALIVLCAAAFIGYRMLDRIRTDNRPPEISVSEEIPENDSVAAEDFGEGMIVRRGKKNYKKVVVK